MNRADILALASTYVTKDRAADHGDLEDNFHRIALLWSAYLGTEIEDHDVALMMALLKVARAMSNPGHADNWVDLAGYAACGGELGMRQG